MANTCSLNQRVIRLKQSLDLGSNKKSFSHVVNCSQHNFKFKMVDESFALNALGVDLMAYHRTH